MATRVSADQMMIPVYINEKIVFDMLAIMEDGFSTVSQVNYTEQNENTSAQKANAGVSTNSTFLGKLLKIDIGGELDHTGSKGETSNVSKEKVHTNVSLLSKFRGFLIDNQLLKSEFDVTKMRIGDFIEVEGELQKNPLIDYMDKFVGIFQMADIFREEAPLGEKSQAKQRHEKNQKTMKQMIRFEEELKHSGTVDFVLQDIEKTVVLSAQEQYLSNDNISEILGGRFKVLGKVIAIYEDKTKSIDLLRKTTLSVLPKETLNDMFAGFKDEALKKLNLPTFKTKIEGPAIIVIPIAIYA